jgi:hypothetical protein
MEQPSGRRFAVLLGAVTAGLACAYGSVFVACGVIALTSPVVAPLCGMRPTRTDIARWLTLVVVAAALLALEYAWFYVPNSSPELRRFWDVVSLNRRDDNLLQTLFRHLIVLTRHAPMPPALLTTTMVVASLAVSIAIPLAWRDARSRRMSAIVFSLCGVPAVALITSGLLDLYPNFERTSLFLLPGLAVLVAYSAQVCYQAAAGLTHRFRREVIIPRLIAGLFAFAALAMVAGGTRAALTPVQAFEDYRSAVGYLGQHAAPDDLIFVHACCEEGFRLYRTLQPWSTTPRVAVGDTGLPCCRRNREVVQVEEAGVREDILKSVPAAFRGRIWLFYTDRVDYWRYSSVTPEGPLLRAALQGEGCRLVADQRFTRLQVDQIDCALR